MSDIDVYEGVALTLPPEGYFKLRILHNPVPSTTLAGFYSHDVEMIEYCPLFKEKIEDSRGKPVEIVKVMEPDHSFDGKTFEWGTSQRTVLSAIKMAMMRENRKSPVNLVISFRKTGEGMNTRYANIKVEYQEKIDKNKKK